MPMVRVSNGGTIDIHNISIIKCSGNTRADVTFNNCDPDRDLIFFCLNDSTPTSYFDSRVTGGTIVADNPNQPYAAWRVYKPNGSTVSYSSGNYQGSWIHIRFN